MGERDFLIWYYFKDGRRVEWLEIYLSSKIFILQIYGSSDIKRVDYCCIIIRFTQNITWLDKQEGAFGIVIACIKWRRYIFIYLAPYILTHKLRETAKICDNLSNTYISFCSAIHEKKGNFTDALLWQTSFMTLCLVVSFSCGDTWTYDENVSAIFFIDELLSTTE